MMLLLRTMNHEQRTSPAKGGTGAERARTADPYLAKVVLSQLSYCPRQSVHSSWFIVNSKNQKQNYYNDFAKESKDFLFFLKNKSPAKGGAFELS